MAIADAGPDRYGNGIADRPLALVPSRNSDSVTKIDSQTDSEGWQRFYVTATQAGQMTLRATDLVSGRTLDDVLTVTVTLVERGRASVAFEQQVWRGETLLNEGRIRIGWVQTVPAETPGDEPRLKTGRIPQRILDRLPEAWPVAASPQD